MDEKLKQALNAIEAITSPNDVIYEVFRTEKRSRLFRFWDFIFEGVPHVTAKLLTDKVMYVVASEKNGKIIEIDSGTIVHITEIPNWQANQKEHFKKVAIHNYVYKKYRKVSDLHY